MGFPIVLGGVSYQIRILLYLDVSHVYRECIPMYLKYILNVPFYSKRIHVSCHLGQVKILQDTCILALGRFLGVTLDWRAHQAA